MSTSPSARVAGSVGFALALAFANPAAAQGAEPPAGSSPPGRAVSVAEDLFAVIALSGKPCGGVKSHERHGESDYLVLCTDGHRYRVYVTQDQRVVVEQR